MLRPSPNHGTQRLPNDDDESYSLFSSYHVSLSIKISWFDDLPKIYMLNWLLFFVESSLKKYLKC